MHSDCTPVGFRRLFLCIWSIYTPGKVLAYLVLSCCMAISAIYELVEFAAAKATGTAANAFLGTQGDIWDTQWDMTWCLIGATCMLLLFAGIHDRALSKLNNRESRRGGSAPDGNSISQTFSA